MIKTIKNVTTKLNQSKLFAGLIIIILNVGGRFIPITLSKSTENFLKSAVSRDIIVFAIAWMGTRDIFISIGLTVLFIVLADYLLNFDSKMCCLPETYKPVESDEEITDEEINKAIALLEKSKRKQMIQEQHNMYYKLFKK